DAAESWLRDRLMNPLPADMPAAARARALDCFPMPGFAEKTLAFYRRVCARGQPIQSVHDPYPHVPSDRGTRAARYALPGAYRASAGFPPPDAVAPAPGLPGAVDGQA